MGSDKPKGEHEIRPKPKGPGGSQVGITIKGGQPPPVVARPAPKKK